MLVVFALGCDAHDGAQLRKSEPDAKWQGRHIEIQTSLNQQSSTIKGNAAFSRDNDFSSVTLIGNASIHIPKLADIRCHQIDADIQKQNIRCTGNVTARIKVPEHMSRRQ